MVIAFFVFVESVTRLVDPPNINTDMLTVSEVVVLFFFFCQSSFLNVDGDIEALIKYLLNPFDI